MQPISRRTFLKQMAAAGVAVTLYANRSFHLAFADAGPTAFKVRILHTNDHHARIEPVLDSAAPPQPLHGGVARRHTLIESQRQSAAGADLDVLLLDAGDVFQGTLYFNQYNGLADLEFYKAMGYELMTLGNHEFDRPAEVLAAFLDRATFPVLSANITAPSSSPIAGKFRPNVVLQKGSERVGFFGLTPQDTPELTLGSGGLTFGDPVEAARAQVAALQAQGVNKIIGLTHVGFDTDLRIAREVPGIAMLIGGHSHTPLAPMNNVTRPSYPELIAGPDGRPVVVVTAWEWGRWMGDITVSFDAAGRVVDVRGRPTEVKGSLEADLGFENRIAVFRRSLDDLRKRVIGQTAVALNGSRADVRTRETNLGNLVAEAMLAGARQDGAQIAITNGGGIRASIPAGPVTVGQVLEVLPFGNTLALTTISGADLKLALENGVSQVETGAGRFPQIAGFRFAFDPAKPAGQRVTAVTFNDQPVDPAASFRVVTNNFMLAGGDGYRALASGRDAVDSGLILADLVERFINVNSPVSAATDGRIAQGAGASQPVSGAPATTPAAPVPAALPNTAGPALPLGWLAGLGVSAIAGGLALRRRAARQAAEEQPEVAEAEEQIAAD